jgi:hypothetical protein
VLGVLGVLGMLGVLLCWCAGPTTSGRFSSDRQQPNNAEHTTQELRRRVTVKENCSSRVRVSGFVR